MKTPIWKVATRQATRILRYNEVLEILRNLELEPSGAWRRKRTVSKGTVQIWIQTLLITGMRFYELTILHSHPELLQDDGTIILEKNKFYDVGKKKQSVSERIVYLSDMGLPIVQRFFEVPPLNSHPSEAYHYLDSVLTATGKKLGYPERSITFKENRTIGIHEVEQDGERWMEKQTAPVERTIITNGLSVRTFRKTWNSWLVNYFKNDINSLTIVEMSMGHTNQTALKHYLSLQFDEGDSRDIAKAVKGFGIHTGWRDKLTSQDQNATEEVKE